MSLLHSPVVHAACISELIVTHQMVKTMCALICCDLCSFTISGSNWTITIA